MLGLYEVSTKLGTCNTLAEDEEGARKEAYFKLKTKKKTTYESFKKNIIDVKPVKG